MGDSFHSPDSITNFGAGGSISSRNDSRLSLVASAPKSLPHVSLKEVPLFNNGIIRKGPVSDIALFLLKVGALETVRRLSKARCPIVWSGLQALQIFCYPPLKWLQKWDPLRNLIKWMQMLSRPLLVLSIATTFSDQSECDKIVFDDNIVLDDTEGSHRSGDSNAVSETHSESAAIQSVDARIANEVQPCEPSTNWLLELYRELEKQGITLPERINEDELYRFHAAANGEFSCLLSSVKKAIHWRETYRLLSGEELEKWSNMVFWHGFDVKNRPCLIVRLVACMMLPPSERPRFAQAVISQVEHGILHLVNPENPQVTVLVDCEGLSLRFPMQVLRSCSTILQENYPMRLGFLFIIRLPPVVRVIAQTFIQVLKPATRQRLKIVGRMYRNALSEYLQTLPSYLGGECKCSRCAKLSNSQIQLPQFDDFTSNSELNADSHSIVDMQTFRPSCQITDVDGSCERALVSAVISILIIWVLIALITGMADLEGQSILPH